MIHIPSFHVVLEIGLLFRPR